MPLRPSTGTSAVTSVDGNTGAVDLTSTYQPLDSDLTAIAAANNGSVLAATTASYTTADETKVDFITITQAVDLDAVESTANSALQNVSEDTTPQLGGTLDAQTNSLENVGAIEEEVNTVATSGATETLDVSTYGVHDITMDQNCTFTFSNPAPSGDCSSFVLILRGAFTPTLPASVDWPDGSAPTYSTPTVYVFTTVDGGTTWLGSSPGKAYA